MPCTKPMRHCRCARWSSSGGGNSHESYDRNSRILCSIARVEGRWNFLETSWLSRGKPDNRWTRARRLDPCDRLIWFIRRWERDGDGERRRVASRDRWIAWGSARNRRGSKFRDFGSERFVDFLFSPFFSPPLSLFYLIPRWRLITTLFSPINFSISMMVYFDELSFR